MAGTCIHFRSSHFKTVSVLFPLTMNSINAIGTFFFLKKKKAFQAGIRKYFKFMSASCASMSSMSKRKYCQSSLTSSHTGHEELHNQTVWTELLCLENNTVQQVLKQQRKWGVCKVISENIPDWRRTEISTYFNLGKIFKKLKILFFLHKDKRNPVQ